MIPSARHGRHPGTAGWITLPEGFVCLPVRPPGCQITIVVSTSTVAMLRLRLVHPLFCSVRRSKSNAGPLIQLTLWTSPSTDRMAVCQTPGARSAVNASLRAGCIRARSAPSNSPTVDQRRLTAVGTGQAQAAVEAGRTARRDVIRPGRPDQLSGSSFTMDAP